MENLRGLAEQVLGSRKLVLAEDGFVHYLSTDETIFEKFYLKKLSNDEFVNSIFIDSKYSYQYKPQKTLKLLEEMGFEECLVSNGKLYVKDMFDDGSILLIKYGVYKR